MDVLCLWPSNHLRLWPYISSAVGLGQGSSCYENSELVTLSRINGFYCGRMVQCSLSMEEHNYTSFLPLLWGLRHIEHQREGKECKSKKQRCSETLHCGLHVLAAILNQNNYNNPHEILSR